MVFEILLPTIKVFICRCIVDVFALVRVFMVFGFGLESVVSLFTVFGWNFMHETFSLRYPYLRIVGFLRGLSRNCTRESPKL